MSFLLFLIFPNFQFNNKESKLRIYIFRGDNKERNPASQQDIL